MACHGPPNEEHIDQGRRSLLLLRYAIDALCLHAQLIIQPLFSHAHIAERRPGILNVSRLFDFSWVRDGTVVTVIIIGRQGLVVHGPSVGLLGAIFKILLVLSNVSVSHVCFDNTVEGIGSLFRRRNMRI